VLQRLEVLLLEYTELVAVAANERSAWVSWILFSSIRYETVVPK
jgi:hypothetical protein